MLELTQIVDLYRRRRNAAGPVRDKAIQIRDAYNGDMVIPLPELSQSEKSAVPNLVATGIDSMAQRISSTHPNIFCAPLRQGIKASEEKARDRRKALYGCWEANRIDIKMRRRARWLLGYSTAPVMLRPDAKMEGPKWCVRDPLATYPGETDDPDDCEVPDAIFAFTRTYDWLRRNYPDAWYGLERPARVDPDDKITLLEFVDDREIILIVLSDRWEAEVSPGDMAPATWTPGIRDGWVGSQRYYALERLDNRVGECTAVVPGRICLDRRQGAYDGIVGMNYAQAMLFALELHAVMEGVFPDEWLVANQAGVQPKIVTMADGRAGIIGQIDGGDLKTIAKQPGYMTNPTRDYLERNQRVTAGIPADFGGESGSNIRTGRRGESIVAATVEFPIQEAQNLFARSAEAENRRAIGILKNYFGGRRKSFYVNWRGARGWVDYVPNKIFETDQNKVWYPFSGADVNNLTIGLGQLVGVGMLSTRSAMEMHPYIEDAEGEYDRIVAEALKRSVLTSVETMASQGQIPPADVARIYELVESNQLELAAAVTKAQEEAQERQSTTVDPVAAGDPAAQPGLAMPGAGAEAGVGSPIPGVIPGVDAMRDQLSALYPATAALG